LSLDTNLLHNSLKLTSGKENVDNVTLDVLLNQVSYDFFQKTYVPTTAALEFITFIKLVNGPAGEENTSPVIHMDMIDAANSAGNNLYVSFRGSAKTSLLHEYMFLYIAVYGGFFNFGEVDVAMYVSDTIDNGVSSMRKQLEFRWQNSEFLQTYVPHAKFTETRWEFINADGKKFCVRGFGASSGVRGFKEYGKRPTWCHEKGTIIFSDQGTMPVEDYPNRSPDRRSDGFKFYVHGLPSSETVTPEHQYWARLPGKNPRWIKAKNLTKLHYIGSPIGKAEIPVAETEEYENFDDLLYPFWQTMGTWYCRGFCDIWRLFFGVYNEEREDYGVRIEQLCKKHSTSPAICTYNTKYHVGLCCLGLVKLVRRYPYKEHERMMPDEFLDMPIKHQKDLLLGFTQMPIKRPLSDREESEFLTAETRHYALALQVGELCERIGLTYKITPIEHPAGKVRGPSFAHWRITITEGAKRLLGVDKKDDPSVKVYIADGYIWRKLRKRVKVKNKIFIPIHTPDHTYLTEFGKSHNCGLDDLMSDKNASSATIIKDIKNIIYKAARQAMHPRKRKIIWTGTPFNQRDPLYAAACSPGWSTRVYPICEKFPCEKEDFKGAWEDRFGYDFVKQEYDMLLMSGEISSFNQELMLKIMSDEERLIGKENILWYSRSALLLNKGRFNFYITTDFATSEVESADFSVISVWALNNKGHWFWVDGVCKRQTMDKNINDLFRFASLYSPQEVGIEISGQQGGFIAWIQGEMLERNIYFNFATDPGSTKPGIRPNTNKLARFNIVVPWFKSNIMFFPEELKDTPIMQECMNELELVSVEGFKSRNDDFCDTISQLASLKVWRPSEEMSMIQDGDTNKWIFDDFETETDHTAMDSYLV